MTDDDFKYLTEEFGSKNLELLKQKDAYPYDCMNKKNCLIKNIFITLKKLEQLTMMAKKLDCHISDEEYLMSLKIWGEFGITNMGDYHGHYLKKRCFVTSCF